MTFSRTFAVGVVLLIHADVLAAQVVPCPAGQAYKDGKCRIVLVDAAQEPQRRQSAEPPKELMDWANGTGQWSREAREARAKALAGELRVPRKEGSHLCPPEEIYLEGRCQKLNFPNDQARIDYLRVQVLYYEMELKVESAAARDLEELVAVLRGRLQAERDFSAILALALESAQRRAKK